MNNGPGCAPGTLRERTVYLAAWADAIRWERSRCTLRHLDTHLEAFAAGYVCGREDAA